MIKIIFQIAVVLRLISCVYAQNLIDDSGSRRSTAERIQKYYGLNLDWEHSTLINLLDMESRLGTVDRINKNYKISIDWKTESLTSLLDIEARMSIVKRIEKNHGVLYDWRQNTLVTLLDCEARMDSAKRISKLVGKNVNWTKFSLVQLQEVEAKLTIPVQQQPLQAAPIQTTVIETKIDGDFEGWDGETVFKLLNGQIWQQSEYHYTYRYAYMPNVIIYPSNSGGWKMKVDGVDKAIGVQRIK